MGPPAGTLVEARRMPVVHPFGPYVFRIHSNENRESREPRHVHVRSDNGAAVFWLDPVGLRESWGYNPAELARIRRIVVARRDELVRKWDDFFGNP